MSTSLNRSNPQTPTNLQFQTQRFLTEFLSGYVAGSAARVVGHPLDTLKILLQNQSSGGPPPSPPNFQITHRTLSQKAPLVYRPIGVYVPVPHDPRFTKSIVRNFLFTPEHTFREKFISLFRGLAAPLVSEGFITALGFGVYKYTQKLVDPTMQDKSVMFGCSILSALVALVPAVPVDVVKIQLQSTAHLPAAHRENFLSCVRRIHKQQGLRGFFLGTVAHGTHDLPAWVLFFLTYDVGMDVLFHRRHWQQDQAALVAGGAAGLLANVVTAPLDTLKTRIQSGHSPNLVSAYRELRNIGFGAFFRGWTYLACMSVLWSGVSFVVYERCVELLDEDFSRKIVKSTADASKENIRK